MSTDQEITPKEDAILEIIQGVLFFPSFVGWKYFILCDFGRGGLFCFPLRDKQEIV